MKRIILSLLLLGCSTFIFADSPITSTNFYTAYLHHKLVKEAKESGELSTAMAEFLSSTEKEDSIQLKVALINALSWDIGGKENSDLYWAFLEKKYGDKKLPTDKLTGDELLCMSYLKIMDDYHSTKEPLRLVSIALNKNPESYTYQMIAALIRAQNAFLNGVYPYGWCQVFEFVSEVDQNKELTADFKQEATDIIFDYINIYEEYCLEEDEPIRPAKGNSKTASSKSTSKTNNKKAKTKILKKASIDQ